MFTNKEKFAEMAGGILCIQETQAVVFAKFMGLDDTAMPHNNIWGLLVKGLIVSSDNCETFQVKSRNEHLYGFAFNSFQELESSDNHLVLLENDDSKFTFFRAGCCLDQIPLFVTKELGAV